MEMPVTHRVPMIKGKNPNWPLKGRQTSPLKSDQSECSSRMGMDFTYNPNPTMRARANENRVNTSMRLRAILSFIIRNAELLRNAIIKMLVDSP